MAPLKDKKKKKKSADPKNYYATALLPTALYTGIQLSSLKARNHLIISQPGFENQCQLIQMTMQAKTKSSDEQFK